MSGTIRLWLSALFLASHVAPAQTVIEDNRSLASDTPEAWAMRYFAGTTLMTSFGETARLAPWRWNIAFDLGSIPHLSDSQQRVGFGGFKNEDLNKSPVFGRLRLALGLPGDWVAELGYTPPLEIGGSRARNVVALAVGRRLFDSDAQQRVGFGGFKNEDLNKSPVFGRLRLALGLPGDWVAELGYTPPLEIGGSRARNVVALAVGRRLFDGDAFTLSMRALGQVGKVQGDITCPARVAGVTDPLQNPEGCRAPSQDTFTTNYYGIDATAGWDAGEWKWYAGAGIARTKLSVQVDALVLVSHDRSRLTADGNLPWLNVGVRHELGPRWSLAAELLYVPLDVRRPPDFSRSNDPLTSVRAQLRYSSN